MRSRSEFDFVAVTRGGGNFAQQAAFVVVTLVASLSVSFSNYTALVASRLFLLLEGRTIEEAFRIGKEIVAVVTKMNPDPVTLKMEKGGDRKDVFFYEAGDQHYIPRTVKTADFKWGLGITMIVHGGLVNKIFLVDPSADVPCLRKVAAVLGN